ncbi:MAG: hypothetical protein WC831_03915 [Parcubacteria group bacterium]|jgi:hypothetical protein
MKIKTKQVILASIALIAMVAMAVPVMAEPNQGDQREMPGPDDMFWAIFSQMSTPDDTANCLVALDNYITQHPTDFSEPDGDTSQARSEMTQMCSQVAQMRTEMEGGMAADGAITNLFDTENTNWHAINNLYFQKNENGVPMGRIGFSNTIDFMTYRFFSFMNNFGNLVQFNDGYISLNAAMVPDMINYGATLTMYGLDFSEQPDIYVSNGANMRKAVEGADISGITWDATAKTLSFTPGHFSSFKAVEKGSKLKAMKISSVKKKTIKYKAGKTFKLTVKGKNLYKKGSDVSCTLGFQQAAKVRSARNGKKVTCTYGMDSFIQGSTYPLTISIIGNGEVTRTNAVRIK